MPETGADPLVFAYITAGSKEEALRIGRTLVEERLAAAGFTPDPLLPAPFAQFQQEEVRRWGEMIRLTGVTMEG